MAAFPLPAGHPFASVRPGYAGFESTPDGSVINATASYVGASGDYPANAITLQLFATQGGTWSVGTPAGLTVQTSPAVNQAYTTAVYTGGLRGQTYTFTSISLTPAQGATLGWTGTVPSVTLTVPGNTTTIASGYYDGGNAGGIYLTPVLDPTLTPLVQGITNYFFVCTTSAAYTSVDSLGTAVIPFPTGATFTAGTTTTLNFTVQCRSNGILGQSSPAFTVGIVQPAVPTLTGVIVGNNINLTFGSTTPDCTFDLSYGGNVIASGITSPYSYTTTTPGVYTFQVRASLCGLTTFSLPSTTTIFPAQPSGVTTTVTGLSVRLTWTGLGTGYTYNVSGTGLTTQVVSMPSAQFTNLAVGSPTFYIQSVYAGIRSTTCNVQVSIPTTPPYNFRGLASGSTITLSWANDTPGATFTLSSSSPSTLATQFGLTTSNYTYTGVPGGSYSFTVFSTSATIPSFPVSIGGLVALSAPTNFGVTTLASTANLAWQIATTGTSFNVSYTVGTTLSSKAVNAPATTTSITGLPAANYTFAIQSIVTGGSSSFVTAAATIIAAPTNFKATSTGTTISLSWIESTPGCTFTITQPTLGTRTTTESNIQYTGATAGSSYLFTLTPCNTTAFVGPSVTTTGTVLTTPAPSAVLSGTNVTVSWTAVTGTGITYTVSSSPRVTAAPAQPGSTTSVTFVSPPPAAYTFSVIASDSTGNVSVTGTTSSLAVPVPQPTNVGAKMTASSQITVTWTEILPGCTFTFTGGPATTASLITNVGTSYSGVFNNAPPTRGYTIAVIAASGGVSSIESVGVAVFTFATFNLTLSATCSQNGSSNIVTAAYSMSSPAAIYGAGTNGTSPYVANVGYSGTNLTPAITSGTAGLAGSYGSGFYGSGNSIINAVPSTFNQFVVPPTNITATANATTVLVKWADSTTAGCRYTVVGTPGTFTSNVAAGTGSTAGVTFTGATLGIAYTFIITASSSGSYTASREYSSGAGGLVTTENATIPYTIRSVSVPSTAVTPINYPATFTATATGTTIAINWGAVTGATGYTVYNSGSSLFTTTTGTTCNYTGTVGQTYLLTVQANGPSASNTNPTPITVTPVAVPTFSSFTQTGSTLTVGVAGTSPSITTPTGLTLASSTANSFTFSGVGGNTVYSFTLTSTGTNATSSATSSFTTMGTPAITSANAQGTATITVNWTYAGPNVSGFTVYSNSVSTTSVGPAIRTATFAQSATTGNTDTVYVVATIGAATSIPSASVGVADLVTLPIITSSTVNALTFAVQWTYSTTASILSDFQVCNSARTVLYFTESYSSSSRSTQGGNYIYNSLFNVPSIAPYSFVVVGRNSVGSTVVSLSSTPVTPVAAPTITSLVQNAATITIAATGTGLSTPTVSPATLSTVSTSSPWAFSGATGNTLYTFTVQANGPGASNSNSSSITTLATPDIPTVSSSGRLVTVDMPSYSSSASFSVFVNPVPTGSWTKTSASATLIWLSIASSSDGTKLAAVPLQAGIYTNASSGAGLWTRTSASASLNWSSIASSSDGTKLAATIGVGGGGIYTNASSGAGVWTPAGATSSLVWSSIASSSDGTKLAATEEGGGLWTNASSGAGSWTRRISAPASSSWSGIASSSDGTKLAAVAYLGGIYTNASSGAGSWTQTSASASLLWTGIASSSDGTKLAAVSTGGGGIWTNASSGAGLWTQTSAPTSNWRSIVSSSDGTRLAALAFQGQSSGIWTNANSGAGSWTETYAPLSSGSFGWYSLASSSDGTKLVAGEYQGGIWRVDLSASPISVQGTSATFAGFTGTTYSVSAVATIGDNSSISSPSPLTSPLSAATGCILWLDGADPNATGISASGTSISVWKDKSGNGNNATSQSGTIPIVNNALTFDGTKYLYVPNISGKLVNTPFVVFVVETLAGPNSYGFFFGDDNTSLGGSGMRFHVGYRNWGNVTMGFWGMDIEDYSMIAQTGETRIWAFYLATGGGATARFIRRNGNNDQFSFAQSQSTYRYLSHFITPCIGRIFEAFNYTGQIAEIIVFPTDIGIPAIQRVEQYLANKWKVSSKSGIITPIATPTAVSATASGGTITVTCGIPPAGTVLNIPTTPTGLTRSGYTTTTFTYTGAAAATTYPFLVYGYNGPATSLPVSRSVRPMNIPGTPTVTVAGTTVNITWTYGGASTFGVTFNVRDGNNNWAGTSVQGSLTTSFTGTNGTSYSIFVFATSDGNRSANSSSASITILGPVTFTQNYQLTTQTRIVGTAASTGAATYSGTRDSTNTLSIPTAAGGILTWTGATGGTRYNGVTIGAAAGAATTSIANQSLYSAFDPKTISSCVLWLDAADPNATGVPAANGATISIWKDKSGLGRDGTATGGPTISSTGLNGNPTMNLNGTQWFLGSVNIAATSLTAFVVTSFALSSPTVSARILSLSSPGQADWNTTASCVPFYQDRGTTNIKTYRNGATVDSAVGLNTPVLGTCVYDGTSNYLYKNGEAQTPVSSTGTFAISTYGIGNFASLASSEPFAGKISEVLVFNGALNRGLVNLVTGYLAWKWGLVSLIPTLPYFLTYTSRYSLPSAFTGLAIWLDAADITTLFTNVGATTPITASGQGVGCWKDKSGKGRNVTNGNSADRQPSYSSTGFNGGYPGILFRNLQSSLLTTQANLVPSTAFGSTTTTVFIVYNRLAGTVNSKAYGLVAEGDQFTLISRYNNGNSTTACVGNYAVVDNAVTGPVSCRIVRDDGTVTVSQFGVVVGSSTEGAVGLTSTPQQFSVGGERATGNPIFFNSYISELIIYNVVLTPDQCASIEAYLANKWKC